MDSVAAPEKQTRRRLDTERLVVVKWVSPLKLPDSLKAVKARLAMSLRLKFNSNLEVF